VPPLLALAIVTLLTLGACAKPEAPVDPQLATAIAAIQAVDNHAHPVRPVQPGEPPDDEYDALPVEALGASPDPVRTRAGSPELVEAHRRMVRGSTTSVLDQLGIETMLANRVAMGPGLPAPRFLWVPFADALMYPLANDSLIHDPDQKAFFAREERILMRYYSESGVARRPATLDEYLNKVVRATIERQKQAGAVAEKFEMAYLRTLAIGNPPRAEAEKAWAGHGDYRVLQDYIFRFIATECGRLGLAVHFHTGAGAGGYFDISGANPMLLEPLFIDPSLRQTNFVMLHGGWPFTRQITALLSYANVYADFSAQTFFDYPHDVAQTIRAWLEYFPDKALFATDAYPYSAEAGWEETGYVAASTGRQALGIALTGMMRDNEITRDRAVELARMVLRDNARKLYGLK
jgi:predicted TIM-barrel fold metal-dependent hydrolase